MNHLEQKVHKQVLFFTLLLIPMVTIQGYIRIGSDILRAGIIGSILFGGVAAFLGFVQGQDTIKKYLVSTSCTLFIAGLFVINGYNLQYHYLVILSLTLSALYFDKKLLIYNFSLISVLIMALTIANPAAFTGEASAISIGSTVMAYVIIFMAIYLLTFNMDTIVGDNKRQHAETIKSLEEIQALISKVDDMTTRIDSDTSSCTDNMDQLTSSSTNIVTVISQMSESIQYLTEKITSIDGEMVGTIDLTHSSANLISQIQNNTATQKSTISEGESSANQLSESMNTIALDISELQVRLNELVVSINKVNSLSASVGGIATQTNLLALNANIEAARAGESGRGFAVVAESIGQLARETTDIVENIDELNSQMLEKSRYVFNQMAHNIEQVQASKDDIKVFLDNFSNIKSQSISIESLVNEQTDTTNRILSAYQVIQEDVEQISAIAEENTATIEEISAIVQDQDVQIVDMSTSISQISSSASELKSSITK